MDIWAKQLESECADCKECLGGIHRNLRLAAHTHTPWITVGTRKFREIFTKTRENYLNSWKIDALSMTEENDNKQSRNHVVSDCAQRTQYAYIFQQHFI